MIKKNYRLLFCWKFLLKWNKNHFTYLLNKISVKGQDLITVIPKTIEVPYDEIRQALSETVFQITNAIKRALDKTPPEHASDIIDFGII